MMINANYIFNVGIVGCGLSATIFHAPFIRNSNGFNLQSFLARNQRVISGFEDVPVYTWDEIDAFLDNLDVVIITTPSDSHYQIAKTFIKYKKHVVVEKPFTLTSQQALDLIQEADKENVFLSVYHNRRWDGDFKSIRDLFTGKVDIGRIVEFESRINRFKLESLESEWRELGSNPASGVLYDLGSHLIDQALVLYDSPKKVLVSAYLRNQRLGKENVDDYAHIILEFINQDGSMGTIVSLKTSLLAKISGPRFIVHGEKGSACIYGFDPQEEQLLAGKMPWDKGYGLNHDRHMILSIDHEFTLPIKKGDWTGFYDALFLALTNQSIHDSVSVKQALDVVRITEAAKKSFELGIKIKVDL